jgi:hypothetical protein
MYFSRAWAIDLMLFEQDFLRGKGKADSYGDFVAQEYQAQLCVIFESKPRR